MPPDVERRLAAKVLRDSASDQEGGMTAQQQAEALDAVLCTQLPDGHEVFVEPYNQGLNVRYRIDSPSRAVLKQDGLLVQPPFNVDDEVAVVLAWVSRNH